MPDRADVSATLRRAGCVFAEDEARLILIEAADSAELTAMVARRVAGEPLEQILGWAEFCGLRIAVEPDVFVPRRRSAVLVREAVEVARGGAVVLDLCCGSGAIGAAIADALPGVELHCADIEPAAVRCARRNIAPFGGHAYEGDLYASLPDSLEARVDVIVANAPYVPGDSIALMPPEARLHEPRVALDGGADGLDVQRRVLSGARRWLAAGGHVLIETSERQVALTAEAYRDNGLAPCVERSEDNAGTVVIGRRVRS